MNAISKLLQWINREGLNMTQFAKKAHISCSSIYRVIRDAQTPIGYAIAKRIEEATNGEITVEELEHRKPCCTRCGRPLDKKKPQKIDP